MQSILHGKQRAGVSQGRNADQALPCFPHMSSLLAAPRRGQRGWDRESPVIPRGIPAGRTCSISARLLSESHREFSRLFSAWDHRHPHETLPLGSLHVPPAPQAHQAVAINRRIQPLSTPHVKSETFYHGRVLHLHLLSICLHLKAPPLCLLQILQPKPLLPSFLTPSPKAMTASSSSHQAILSSIVTSNVFSLSSQQSFL